MEHWKKQIDTREYVAALRELTEQGKEVPMRISGNSMAPFLVGERDWISFRRPDRILRRGDMVFYERENGQFVMHRICRIHGKRYFLIGDAQRTVEGPIRREQIFAIVTKVRRKGMWIGPGNFWWEFFARVWIRIIPLRGVLCRIYGFLNLK